MLDEWLSRKVFVAFYPNVYPETNH